MVQLIPEVMWCDRHLLPFRAEWPKGFAIGMVELFKEAVRMPAIIDAARSDTENLEAAFERFRPVCCFIDRDVMTEIYRKAGVKPL